MSHERCDRWGALLTADESRALLDEIDRWCRRTGTNYNKLVIAAGVFSSTRHKVRVRGARLSVMVAGRLSKAMQQHGKGISREDYRQIPKPWRREPLVEQTIRREIEQLRIVRDTCPRCGGVRMNYECSCLSAKPVRSIAAA